METPDYWAEVEKTLRAVSRDEFQQEFLGTWTPAPEISQFDSVKFVSSGGFGTCSNCRRESVPLQLYQCSKRPDNVIVHRLYCRRCVRGYHVQSNPELLVTSQAT